MIRLKYKLFKIIFIILTILLFILATFFLITGLMMKDEKNAFFSSNSSVNVEELIAKIKEENENLVYESNDILEFTSLVFFSNNKYNSYLISNKTGKELKIDDIIKKDKWNNFQEKEEELLRLKYPEFIVKGILEDDGNKVYVVKSNEIIIYYYDYKFAYDYSQEVFLTINYNEIKDFLNFSYQLDLEYENEDGYSYSKDKKTVAITFDDGPSSSYNKKILEVLEKNKAHATFFMVGTMMNNCQKCVLDTYQSGNEVASHTYNHINIKKNSIEDVNESIKKTDDLFCQITGDHIKYVRPPYGAYNKTNLENVDYPLILWNIDPEDWRYHDVEKIVDHVMEHVSDGSIILMHEIYQTSLEALEILLPKLYALGYQVVSIGELANLKDRNIEVGHAYRSLT